MTRCASHPTPPDGVLSCGCTTDVIDRLYADAGIDPTGRDDLWATLESHLAPHLGPLDGVLHVPPEEGFEAKGNVTEVLLHRGAPGSDAVALATVGMSRRRLRVPRALRRRGAACRAELVLRLPAAPTSDGPGAPRISAETGWALLLLRMLAQLPHELRVYVGDAPGLHTEHRCVPLMMLPEIPFDAVALARPDRFGAPLPSLPRAHSDVPASRGTVRFLSVLPITATELEFAHDRGTDRLFEALAEAGVDDAARPGRETVV